MTMGIKLKLWSRGETYMFQKQFGLMKAYNSATELCKYDKKLSLERLSSYWILHSLVLKQNTDPTVKHV